MPEANSFQEVVQFVWNIEQPEAASARLLASLGTLDAKIGEFGRSVDAIGARFVASFNLASTSVQGLVAQLQTAIALQGQLGSVGSQRVGGGGSSFTSNTQMGPYEIIPSGAITLGGKFVSPHDVPQAVADMAAQIRSEAIARARATIIDPLNPQGGQGLGAFNPSNVTGGGRIPIGPGMWQYPNDPPGTFRDDRGHFLTTTFPRTSGGQFGGYAPSAGGAGGGIPPGWVGANLGADMPGDDGEFAQDAKETARLQREARVMYTNWVRNLQRRDEVFRPDAMEQLRGQAGEDWERIVQGANFRAGYDSWARHMRGQERQGAYDTGIEGLRQQARASQQEDWMLWRKAEMQSQAGVAYDPYSDAQRRLAQQQYESFRQQQLNQPMGLEGLQGPAYLQGLQSNLQTARQEAGRLFEQVRSGNQEAIPAFNRQAAEVQRLQQQYQDAGRELGGVNDRFGQHVMRVAESIVIWLALRAVLHGVVDTIGDITREMLNFSDVQARVGFISGQTPGVTQNQFAQAAQYGITPRQAGPALLTAAQLGVSNDQQEQARQLALVFGADQYNRALIELNQTEERASAIGVQNVNVMDFIAQSYKTLPGSMSDYFNALQTGIQLHAQFGVSVEAMGLAVERAAVNTGQSTEQMGTLFQSILSKLGRPETQDELQERFGIKPGTQREMVEQIVELTNALAAAGRSQDIQTLMEAVQGGGLGGFARVRQMTIAFQELDRAMKDANPTLAEFDDLMSRASDSGITKINQLTAAWQNFLLAMGNTGIVQGAFDMLIAGLGGVTDQLNAWPSIFQSLLSPVSEGWQGRLQAFDENNPPPSPWEIIAPGGQGLGADYQRRRLEAMAGRNNTSGGMSKDNPFVSLPEPPPFSTTPPPAFGGFNTWQKDAPWTFEKFTESVRSFEKQIAGQGGYKLDQRTEVYYDETSRTWRTLLADSNAIRYATEEMQKLMQQQITGTFNVPAGGDALVWFSALTAGFVPNTPGGPGGSGSSYVSRESRLNDETLSGETPRLITTLTNLDAATRGVLAYLQAHGVNVGTGAGQTFIPILRGSTSSYPDAATRGIAGYLRAHEDADGSGMMGAGRSPSGIPWRPYRMPYVPGTTRNVENERSSPSSLSINNRINVSIDGRQLASYMNRQQFRQFENIRSANTSAPNTQVMM